VASRFLLLADTGRPFIEEGKLGRQVIDHDHRTGLVRGLITQRENMILGLANDNPAYLHQLAEYVTGHRCSRLTVEENHLPCVQYGG
jgi:hypothetical protein